MTERRKKRLLKKIYGNERGPIIPTIKTEQQELKTYCLRKIFEQSVVENISQEKLIKNAIEPFITYVTNEILENTEIVYNEEKGYYEYECTVSFNVRK